MPLEFRCSQCGQLLRVPESAAGKSARCPKCQALMTVPGVATAVPDTTQPELSPAPPPPTSSDVAPSLPPPTSNAPSSRPAQPPAGNPFAGDQPATSLPPPPPKPEAESPFAQVGGASTDPLNPYASPAPTAYTYRPEYYALGARTGLPWENEPHSVGCWFRTMAVVLGSPTRAFTIMRQYGGLTAPLMYNLYAVGMLMALLLLIVVPIALLIAFAASRDKNGGDIVAGIAIASGIGLIAAAFYGVMLTVVWPAVCSAITHLMLMLWGSARQGFETTFRVVSFGYFSVLVPGMLLAFVPYLGGFAMMIWALVVIIIGLSRGHEISGGKATLAVLTPVFLCCGLYFLLIISFVTAGFSGAFK